MKTSELMKMLMIEMIEKKTFVTVTAVTAVTAVTERQKLVFVLKMTFERKTYYWQ